MTDFKDNRLHNLPRLRFVFSSTPLYFITTSTHHRAPLLGTEQVHAILKEEWEAARPRHGWLIGRYMVLPDHVHFFCTTLQGEPAKPLSAFIMRWKEWTAKRMNASMAIGPVWEKGFFDHLLRSDESYREKCDYVRQNPVVAGLVANADDWKSQGYIDFDDRT